MVAKEISEIQTALCVSKPDGRLGPHGSSTRTAIRSYLLGQGVRGPQDVVATPDIRSSLNSAVDDVPSCKNAGFLNAYEVGMLGVPAETSAKRIAELQQQLLLLVNGQTLTIGQQTVRLIANGQMDAATRAAIAKVRELKGINKQLDGQMDPKLRAVLTQ